MRWLFGLLVLANVGLYMWGRWFHEPLVERPPAPLPDVAPEKMKLLSEPGASLTVRAAQSMVPGDEVSASGEAGGCYRLGPFPSLERAQHAAARIESWGIRYVRVPEFRTLNPIWRVYLPPFPSKEAAERRRRELSQLGFKDHAVIHEPGMENAISLGLFAVERNARAHVEDLARRGVRAALQPLPNLQSVYWLALAGAARDEHLGEVPLSRFALEEWGSPGVSLRPAACLNSPSGP
ncbi:MAG TPA: SPOR domain-containing protein [Burkholderiales bacterium]